VTEPFVFRQWLDQLESVLLKEAELAGLLSHPTMVGSGREFFIRRVLGSILPPSVHIGSGRVISADHPQGSRQVDIIIYDPRFPVLEVEKGVGLYFVEGVIATIEVKSVLNSERLREALENCESVMSVGSHVDMDDLNKYAHRLFQHGVET